MAFSDGLERMYSIGKFVTTLNTARQPVVSWQVLYEVQGSHRSLKPNEVIIADATQVKVTHKMYFMLEDINNVTLSLESGMLIYPVVPFDYNTQKNLPRYEIVFSEARRGIFYYVESKEVNHAGV